MVKKNDKLLLCKQDFLDYLEISDVVFQKYIKLGMPAFFDGRSWIGHADNINNWVLALTRQQRIMREEPEDKNN